MTWYNDTEITRSVGDMLKKSWQYTVRYWRGGAAIVIILIGLGFQLFGPVVVTRWVLGIASLLLAIPPLVDMWYDVRSGHYSVNILPIAATVSAVVFRQYWVAITVITLFTATGILEDYIRRRTHAELSALLGHAPQVAHVFRGRKAIDTA
ncbi:MAG TPA: hypothetical protein VF261_00330, partial [Candidatus Saccharimonadales bacterium]